MIALTVASAARSADSATPRLVSADGTARARAHARLPWRDVDPGRELVFGHQLRCEGACTVTLGDAATLTLEPRSVVKPEGPAFTRFPADGVARRVDVVDLDEGALRVARPRDDGSALVVALPGGMRVAIRTGELEARTRSGRSVISVRSATSLVRAGSERGREGRAWRRVEPGLYDVTEDGRLTVRSPVAPARWDPTEPSHRPVAIATDEPEALVAMSWEAGEGRSKQRLVITTDDGEVVEDRPVAPNARRASLTLREGRYRARLVVADGAGVWSEPSTPLPLAVIRLALPRGGIQAAPDTFVVPGDSTLRLLGAKGVEVALGRGGFLPARRELSLPDAAATQLRLRVAGTPSTESRYRVDRRELRAEIQLGPSAPVWPEDSISAEVRLVDPSGHVDVSRVKPRFVVRLGADDIPTHFTFNGERWHGRIPGRVLRKPQLLEVVVQDDVGQPIGQAYVEVVTHRRRPGAK